MLNNVYVCIGGGEGGMRKRNWVKGNKEGAGGGADSLSPKFKSFRMFWYKIAGP